MRKIVTVLVLCVTMTVGGAALAQGGGAPGGSAAQASGPGAPVLAAAFSLGGQVTGVRGRPLANTEVELFRFGEGRVQTAAADAAGYFRFAGLDATGVYWVRAWAQGYHVAESGWAGGNQRPFLVLTPAASTATLYVRVVDPTSGAAVGGAKVELQQVGMGQVDHGQTGPSGLVRLQAPAGTGHVLRIWDSDRVPVQIELPELTGGSARSLRVELALGTGSISGNVVMALSGQPLAGAVVRAIRPGHGVAAVDRTGPDGDFQLTVPAGAEYQVRVDLPGYAGSQTASFRLNGGDRRDFSGEQRISLTPASATLAGRLLDDRGYPVAGRTVLVQRWPLGTVADAVTDGEGRFNVAGLPARPGVQYRTQVLPAENNWWPASSPWVELTGGRVTEVQLQMAKMVPPNMGSEGQITGTVTDAAGQPVAGVQLDLWQAGQGRIRTTMAAADGSFDFGKVPSNRLPSMGTAAFGAYYVVASGNGRFGTTLATTAGAAGSIEVLPSRLTQVEVVMYDRWVAAGGQVVDQDGRPLADALVELQPATGGSLLLATTDERGHWALPQVSPLDSYRVQAVRTGYPKAVAADLVPDGTATVARDLALRLSTVDVTGQVTDPLGIPISGATVTARGAGYAGTATTDESGYYALQSPTGRSLMVSAQADGHNKSGMGPQADITPLLDADLGKTLAVDVRMWPATGDVVGTVLGPEGQPAPGVAVELVREGHGAVDRTATDDQGRYRFAAVLAGSRYAVRAVDRPYRYLDSSGLPRLFTLGPGTMENIHLEIGPPKERESHARSL